MKNAKDVRCIFTKNCVMICCLGVIKVRSVSYNIDSQKVFSSVKTCCLGIVAFLFQSQTKYLAIAFTAFSSNLPSFSR